MVSIFPYRCSAGAVFNRSLAPKGGGAGSIGPGNDKAAGLTLVREGAQVLCVDRNGAAAEETPAIILSEGCIAAGLAA